MKHIKAASRTAELITLLSAGMSPALHRCRSLSFCVSLAVGPVSIFAGKTHSAGCPPPPTTVSPHSRLCARRSRLKRPSAGCPPSHHSFSSQQVLCSQISVDMLYDSGSIISANTTLVISRTDTEQPELEVREFSVTAPDAPAQPRRG